MQTLNELSEDIVNGLIEFGKQNLASDVTRTVFQGHVNLGACFHCLESPEATEPFRQAANYGVMMLEERDPQPGIEERLASVFEEAVMHAVCFGNPDLCQRLRAVPRVCWFDPKNQGT